MEMNAKFFEIKTNEKQINDFLVGRTTNELMNDYIKKIYFKVDGKSHERLSRVLEKLAIKHKNYHRDKKMFFVYLIKGILKDIQKYFIKIRFVRSFLKVMKDC